MSEKECMGEKWTVIMLIAADSAIFLGFWLNSILAGLILFTSLICLAAIVTIDL